MQTGRARIVPDRLRNPDHTTPTPTPDVCMQDDSTINSIALTHFVS